MMRRSLGPFQKYGLRRAWERTFGRLKRWMYMRGALAEAGGWAKLEELVRTAPGVMVEPLTIDLADGLTAAEARIEADGPAAVRLMYSQHPVGLMRDRPLAEPLRARHLRPYLREGAGFELLAGLSWQSLARAR